MSFKCKIGLHSWDGCKCTDCGKTRDERHDWGKDCEKCSKCGKTRENQHDWSKDCEKCSKCGKIEIHHDRSKDCEKCSKCGKIRENHHDWSKDCEKCSKCGITRTEQHNWSKDCEKCSKCGKTRNEQHKWDGCICTKCGKARDEQNSGNEFKPTIKNDEKVVISPDGKFFENVKEFSNQYKQTADLPWGYYHCYDRESDARIDYQFLHEAIIKSRKKLNIKGKIQLRHSNREGEPNRWWLIILISREQFRAFFNQTGISLNNLSFDDHEEGDSEFISNSEHKSTLFDELKFEDIVVKKPESQSTQNNVKKSVNIGNQIWMSENLNVEHYRNGDKIPQVKNPEKFCEKETGAWCYYMNELDNGIIYGKLYNWYAVNDPRGLAPSGWHVPSDTELKQLIKYLGGENKAGKKMKSTNGWNDNGNGDNSSGFSALPGGTISGGGEFYHIGEYSYWWSSSKINSDSAWFIGLGYDGDRIGISDGFMGEAFYVRCVNDKISNNECKSTLYDEIKFGDSVAQEAKPLHAKHDERVIDTSDSKVFSIPKSIQEKIESIEALLKYDYGCQTIIAPDALTYEWYKKFNKCKQDEDFSTAINILEIAIQNDTDNGLPWIQLGFLFEDIFEDNEAALQLYLTGAKKCDSYRTYNLQASAEILLLKFFDIPNSLLFFLKTILSISKDTKRFGVKHIQNLNTSQERAFQFTKLFLKKYSYHEYYQILYDIKLATCLNDDYIKKIETILISDKSEQITRNIIDEVFPKVINHLNKIIIQEHIQQTKKEDNIKTVKIGNQIWMAANLDVSHFRNGELIPNAKTEEEWVTAGEQGMPAWCYYAGKLENFNELGKLYNWYAVNDPRILAPKGWRVPNKSDFETLLSNFGDPDCYHNKIEAYNSLIEGGSSGFSADADGWRNYDGSFDIAGYGGNWWSSSEDDTYGAWNMDVTCNTQGAVMTCDDKELGFSVRCIKEEDSKFISNTERKSTLFDDLKFGDSVDQEEKPQPVQNSEQNMEVARRIVVAHINQMCVSSSNQTIIENLKLLLEENYLEFILKTIKEKSLEAKKDCKGHSKQIYYQGGPFVSASAWPCSLNDLSVNFMECIGVSYGQALPKYYANAMEKGASCFIHLFYCLGGITEGITVAYCGKDFNGLILPTELKDEFGM